MLGQIDVVIVVALSVVVPSRVLSLRLMASVTPVAGPARVFGRVAVARVRERLLHLALHCSHLRHGPRSVLMGNLLLHCLERALALGHCII